MASGNFHFTAPLFSLPCDTAKWQLISTGLGDADYSALAVVLRSSTALVELELACNQVTDTGVG